MQTGENYHRSSYTLS